MENPDKTWIEKFCFMISMRPGWGAKTAIELEPFLANRLERDLNDSDKELLKFFWAKWNK